VTTNDRRVILAGANPGVRLFDEDGNVTAYASIWMVDWSIRGAGTALVLWHDNAVRVVSEDVDLASWLEHYFVRSFPEVQDLRWTPPTIERAAVDVRMDLASGLSAQAADLHIEMTDVLDHRSFTTDDFPLATGLHSLSLVIAPVRSATISGVRGKVRVDGTRSSAFLTTAEVWQR
jgi:hypothetical protein